MPLPNVIRLNDVNYKAIMGQRRNKANGSRETANDVVTRWRRAYKKRT